MTTPCRPSGASWADTAVARLRRARRPFTVVHDWAELVTDLQRSRPPRLVLADVDPAVAGWGADADALRQGFARIEVPLLDALPAGTVLVWTSNTGRVADQIGDPPHHTPAGNRLLLGARKPGLRSLRGALGALLDEPSKVVVGDQWLVDGLLAWRLDARFVLWRDARPSPWWAGLQGLAGVLLVRPLHRLAQHRARPRGRLLAPD